MVQSWMVSQQGLKYITSPLMLQLEGDVQLTFDTGIVGAKEMSSGPVGTAADNPLRA